MSNRQSLIASLLQAPSGLTWCRKHTELVDQAIQEVWSEEIGSGQGLALVATGGYGRAELSPCSDCDLVLVSSGGVAADRDDRIKRLYDALQVRAADALGISISYALRRPADAVGLDDKSLTALSDGRFIAGEEEVALALLKAAEEALPVPYFLRAKIQEREKARRGLHQSPLVTKPNLKEGAGGLRAFQSANWIRYALGERMIRPTKEYDAVMRVRNVLHALAGRKQDSLALERREQVAEIMGVDPFDLGGAIASHMESLHREELRAQEAILSARFPLAKGVHAIGGEIRFSAGASIGSAARGISQGIGLGLTVPDLASELTSETGPSEALEAVSSGSDCLMSLARCGVLDGLLPELTACRHLMPRDSSHQFSVYQHTIEVVRKLESLKPGTFLGDLMSSLPSRGPLFLAALLHDVGKSDLSRPHSESGAEMAESVCRRWRLYADTTSLVCWLVREHLTLAHFLRMRDVTHPDTAAELAELVQTEDRLVHLTLLTWADVSSVSEDAWTPIQQEHLKQLFALTSRTLEGTRPEVTERAALRRLEQGMAKTDLDPDQLKAFLSELPAHYLLSAGSEQAAKDCERMQIARNEGPQIEFIRNSELSFTEVHVTAKDEPGVLSRILAAIYAEDCRLLHVRAATTKSDPYIIDAFSISKGDRVLSKHEQKRLEKLIQGVLSGESDEADVLRKAGKQPDREQEVYQWRLVEGNPSILEIQAPRGRGLAYRMSKKISDCGWNITAARLGQWAGRGAAAFYITDRSGEPVTMESASQHLGPSLST